MPTKPLEPGDPLSLGRFELLARLGEGGHGAHLQRASDRELRRRYRDVHAPRRRLAYRWTDNIEQNTATLH
jgi:hypothetical protein